MQIEWMMGLGTVVLALSWWAMRRNRLWRLDEMPLRWQQWWRFRRLFSYGLAVMSVFLQYPLAGKNGEYYTVHGVPYLVAAFDAQGRDYVGALSLPFMLLNAVFWFLLPHALFWMAGRLSLKNI